MLIEWRVLLQRGDSDYRFDDTFSNLACGVGSQLWGALSAIVSWYAYTLIADSLILFHWWTGSPRDWLLAIIAIDLSYYWFHRTSHRVRLFWSFHVVHHQSESYNLSVALRQSWFGGFVTWIFYTPWLVLGLPPTALVAAKLVNLLYQYWIHTRLVGKLPFGLEWLMSSPSNHRVHHGRDDRSLDSNYGGIFIIWDRLFGTFVPENEEPPYGTVSPIRSWDPIHANTEGFHKIALLYGDSSSWRERWLSIFGPPEWSPGVMQPSQQVRESLYAQPLQHMNSAVVYVLIHFLIGTAWLLFWLSGGSDWGSLIHGALGASVIAGLWAWGTLLGQQYKVWLGLECVRFVMAATAALAVGADSIVLQIVWIGSVLHCGLLARVFRDNFKRGS